jgi:hypothetical protein
MKSLTHDDEQVIPVGSSCSSETDIVVGPGHDYPAYLNGEEIRGKPILTTIPSGDDKIHTYPATGTQVIMCGENLIAETQARNEEGKEDLTVTSAWRNPERNEQVGGVKNSIHQYGKAIDVVPEEVCIDPPRCQKAISPRDLYCLLEHVAEIMLERVYGKSSNKAREDAMAEGGGKPTRCDGKGQYPVDHLHVEVE